MHDVRSIGNTAPLAPSHLASNQIGRSRLLVLPGRVPASHAAWTYPSPSAPFAALKDYVAFYVRAMDACYVDDELVRPQPGGFYGGWITDDVVGPFKGEPGTEGW